MQHLTLAKRAWLLLLVGVGVVYLVGLGSLPLVGPDEPRYAQVAREMLIRGDLVTPTLNGRTWFEKPALLYWLMMAAYRVLGVTELAARLAPACAGIATIGLVGWVARRVEFEGGVEMRGYGFLSAALTASCAGLMVFSRGASFDIILTFTLTLALASFLSAQLERRAEKRRTWMAVFFVAVGLSLLAKGLVGVVLPCAIIGLYVILRRRWVEGLGVDALFWGVPLALLVASLWYAPVIARHGREFVDEFFVQHHFQRYVSNKYKHPQPFYFYIPVAALLVCPWTFFLGSGLMGAVRSNWRAEDASSRVRVFAFAWLLAPLLFFSVSSSKLPGYLLPALPGAALLAAEPLARYVRGEGGSWLMRLTGALALSGIGGLVYACMEKLISLECALVVGVPVASAGALALVRPDWRGLSATAIISAALGVVLLINLCGLERVGERESTRGLLTRAAERGYTEAPIYQLHTLQRTPEFYAAGRLAYDEQGEPLKFEGASQVVERARERAGAVLVILPLRYVGQLTGNGELQTEVIADNSRLAIVAARAR